MFETEKQMMVDIVANDVDSAVQIHETHTNVWPEIEYRETTFSNLVQAGNAMIEDGHYAATDIHERLQVRGKRQRGEGGDGGRLKWINLGTWIHQILDWWYSYTSE